MRTFTAYCVAAAMVLGMGCRKAENPSVQGFQIVTIDGRDYETFDEKELGTCVTVDGGTDANGALSNVRTFLQNESTHGSIKDARDNLDRCADIASGDLSIVGHGVSGAIFVGGADHNISNKTIGFDNDSVWKMLMDDLQKGSGRLSLLSCNTGSGIGGAKLLNKLQTETGRSVRALNALAFFSSTAIYLEKGAVWNEATPSVAAVITPRPKPQNEPFQTPTVVHLGRIPLLTTKITGFRVGELGMGRLAVTARQKDEVTRFLRLFDLGHPFAPPGPPLSPETLRITVTTKDGSPRTLILYGDSLAQDADVRTRFYDVARDEPGGVEGWLRSLQ